MAADHPIKIYVAGPITHGDRMANTRQAIDAANHLAELGFVPFVPHLCATWELLHPRPYEWWMAYDRTWLLCCQGLLRLPGYSQGADREVATAVEHKIPVFRDLAALSWYFEEAKHA